MSSPEAILAGSCSRTVVRLPNIRILFDVYHTQINEGDILDPLKRYFPLIHHVQISVPSRG